MRLRRSAFNWGHKLGVNAQRTPGASRPFVGRESEFSELVAAYYEAVEGHAGLVMLAGEPGIGKTALVSRFAEHVQKLEGLVLTGHCFEEGSRSQPYLPFVEALGRHVNQSDLAQVASELSAGASDLARILPEVVNRHKIEPRQLSEPDDDRWRLLQTLAAFVRNISVARPVLLIIEDLHWADSGTLEVLIHIARTLTNARLLVVSTYRDIEVDRSHSLSAALAELRRTTNYRRIGLDGLSVAEVQELYESVHNRSISLEAATRLHDQTEGNPLFVQELLHYWQEADSPHRRTVAGVPAGLRDVLGMRLNRLSTGCNDLLSIAAVLGREFDLETLGRVASQQGETLFAALEEATQAAVLEEQPRPGALRYRFVHALFRQTLYEELGAPRRSKLHQEVARTIESHHVSRLAEHAVELVEHFSHCTEYEDLAKAVKYGELAAQRAMSVFAYREAARLLDLAIEIQNVVDPGDLERRGDLLFSLGEALVAAGERDRVVDSVAPDALALAEALDDPHRAFKACRFVMDVMSTTLPSYWQEKAELYAVNDPSARMRFNNAKAPAAFHDLRFRDAKALLQEAIALAREVSDPGAAISSASELLRAGLLPEDQEKRLFADVQRLPHTTLSMRERAVAHFDAVTIHLEWGDRRSAEAEGQALAALAGKTGNHTVVLHAAVAEAVFGILDGRLPEAIAASAKSTMGSYPRMWRARIAGWQGDAASGERELASAAEMRSAAGPIYNAFILAYLGRFPEAKKELARALPIFSLEDGDHVEPFMLSSLFFEAAVVCGDKDSTAELMDRMTREQRRLAKPALVLIPRLVGGAAELLGQPQLARSKYLEAIEFCEKIRYRPELALSRLALAQLLLKHHAEERHEAYRQLDLAIPELDAMGMKPFLEKAGTLRAGEEERSSRTLLSQRQAQVLDLVAAGKTTREIADELVLSERTIERHIADIYAKIGARNRAEAIVFALGKH